jgi:hypothetical protein
LASARTGRNHVGTGLEPRCHVGEAWQKWGSTSIPPPPKDGESDNENGDLPSRKRYGKAGENG